MPRRARLFIPGCCHHIMARGIDGLAIFTTDAERERFISLLAEHAKKTGTACYAWSLMPNHYHLLVRCSEKPLGTMMKPLNSRYATFFNKRHNRRGYLFQDRFKSIATQDQGYLEELIRYVHLNPLRAGLCRDLNELDVYPWCGHAALMGTHSQRFQDVATVLRRFGKTASISRQKYRAFLEEGIGEISAQHIEQLRLSLRKEQDREEPGMWVIGDPAFVRKALQADRNRRLALANYAREGWTIERICACVASQMNVDTVRIRRRARGDDASACRKAVAYLACRVLGMPVVSIARYFDIGGSAVSMMANAGETVVKKSGIQLTD
ncbi:MAG: hypothetical protein GF418_15845 [Chitinivibrionales bacterium]|nr:hypothetical protein [Chitinivibrionales bacterium]